MRDMGDTPVAAARPSGTSSMGDLAEQARSSTSGGVSLASLSGRLLRSESPIAATVFVFEYSLMLSALELAHN